MERYIPDTDCPECGNDAQATRVAYHEAGSPTCGLREPAEHMHRGCNWCGYEWTEAPPELAE
jgi:hypothetical protein